MYIKLAELFTHMEVIGSTGVGNSFLIEGILKCLILLGHGICVLDPTGDLYRRLMAFCAYVNIQRPELHLARRVIPFDVAETKHIIGFNPVARNARIMTYQVVALMEAIRKCWGRGSFFETPRLARWLYNTGYAVVDSKTTLAQSYHLLNPHPNPYREAITARISNPRIRAEWDWLAQQKPTEREERLESCFNRLKAFVDHDLIRLIVGQHTDTLDFPEILQERKILLVNLAKQNSISEDDQHMLGTLITNELLTAAFARPENQRAAFVLAIDEFQHFVTKDMCEILDGARKYGLHLILAHQFLHQLKQEEAEVYHSTLTNARAKAVFGGLDDEDLDILAKELYTGEFDPDEIKDEIWQTKFRPVETTRLITTSGGSEGSGIVNHSSLASGRIHIPGSDFWSPGTDHTTDSTTYGSARNQTFGSNWSETRAPFYEFHEFKELSTRAFRQLEEQLYIKKAQLKRQSRQHASILIPGRNVQLVKTSTLRDFERLLTDRHRQDFKAECIEASGCFKPHDQAKQEIEDLDQKLLAELNPPIEVRQPQAARIRALLPNPAPPLKITAAPLAAAKQTKKLTSANKNLTAWDHLADSTEPNTKKSK